ncbi:phosphate ABC transporter permease subunit PstC [Pinisolibacter sp.]|uniref:phosphate ABC transporter permease subunit PstC n=1 Tax=Pinisolibacter sp. TaxID=2172024 RepID=UPI002FDEA531
MTVDSSTAPTVSSVAASLTKRGHVDVGDGVFRFALNAAAVAVLVILGAIVVLLFKGGFPALKEFGLGFFLSTDWNPVTEHYGAGVMLYGTLITSLIAMVLAFPASLGIALFLTEVAPERFRRPIGTAIQLLAAIPSIIYGMWGFFVVSPLMASTVQPFLTSIFGPIPLIGMLFSGAPVGTGILTAGLILALMIMPFITAMFVEIFTSVPPVLKEAAYGVGATMNEVFRAVTIPYGRTALVGAVMLGLGRALGETMAVTFVIGNANRIAATLYSPGASIASTIANEFPEAGPGSMKLHALLELGFSLFVISFLVLALARALVRNRMEG